jgi:hypothetical protein
MFLALFSQLEQEISLWIAILYISIEIQIGTPLAAFIIQEQ